MTNSTSETLAAAEAEGADKQEPNAASSRPFGTGGFGRRRFGATSPPTNVTPSPDAPAADTANKTTA